MNKHIIGIIAVLFATIFYNSCTGNTEVKAPEVIDLATPVSIPRDLTNDSIQNVKNDSIQKAKNDLIARLTDSLVWDIRSEYNHIVKNKESYKKVVLYINHYDESEGEYDEELGRMIYEEDEDYREETITYYIDKNKQIRLVSHYKVQIHHPAIYGATLTEYYLKNNDLIFIYQQIKNAPDYEAIEMADKWTTATEKRIYTTGDISHDYSRSKRTPDGKLASLFIDNCVRYLFKSVECKFSDVNESLQKTDNTEIDCSDSTEDIPYSVQNLIDMFYNPTEADRISKEPLPIYYYDRLFGQQ